MIKISDKDFFVNISEKGGNLTSINKNGIEYQWQGSEDSWRGQDVVIFPFVARLKDGVYLVDGKEFSMKNHGLARYSILDVVEKTEKSVTLSLKWSYDTLLQYPYKFELYVTYKIEDNKLDVLYTVKNVDNKPIYFGIGGHPAFNLPLDRKENYDSIDGNYIEFDKEYDFENYFLNDDGSYITKLDKFGKIKKIELSKEIFRKYKTLILKAKNINSLNLVRKDGLKIKMEFNDPDVLAIWTKENFGSYICIEPWNGIPDFDNPKKELKEKELIQKLDINSQFEFKYSIIV